MEYQPIHFYDEGIAVHFDVPPAREKTPPCPSAFTWGDHTHRIVAMLAEWSDFTRRGRMAKNMRPAHAAVATTRGSLGVGRFFFRVQIEGGRVFDIYYDRAPKNVDETKGQWFIYRELEEK